MKKLLAVLLFAIVASGCTPGTTKPNIYTDTFTGQVKADWSPECAYATFSGDICTSFKKRDSITYMVLHYRADDWLFMNQAFLKIEGESSYVTVSGETVREVGYGGRIFERMTVRVTPEVESYMRRAVADGGFIRIRLIGDNYYAEQKIGIGKWGFGSQWGEVIKYL